MNKLTRKEVYDVIDSERDYQDNYIDKNPDRREDTTKHEHEVGEYLTMMRGYMRRADESWIANAGNKEALENIRKIAGICVKCMEQHGAEKRGKRMI